MRESIGKNELINVTNIKFEEMLDLIYSISESKRIGNFDFGDRDKNIRDILTHLYEWHKLLLNFINYNLKGIRITFLPEAYNWENYQGLNFEFWKKHQNTSFEDAVRLLKESHDEVITFIENAREEVLFEKGYYDWTVNSLVNYIIPCASEHYEWAIENIKKYVEFIKE